MDDNVREALKALGFTDYYTSILITLLRDGEMDARVLSEKTKVPYSRIYEVLNGMIEKGIVTKIDGRPSTYVANPPQEMLGNLRARMERKFERHSRAVRDYLDGLYAPKKSNVEIPLTLYFGEKPNLVRVKRLMKNTSRTLVLVLEEFDKFFPALRDEFNYLKLTSVDVTVVVPAGLRPNAFLDELGSFARVIEREGVNGQVLLSDEETVHAFFRGRFGFLKARDEEYLGASGTHSGLHGLIKDVVSRQLGLSD
ncbi:MAG: hypothetical protein Kow0069_26610 [Promethearchaeota archaeon]